MQQAYTGYTPSHIRRLARRYLRTGRAELKRRTQPVFAVKYTHDDIVALAEMSELFGHPNGKVLAAVCRMMRDAHGDRRFTRLGDISCSHVYNLRKRRVFRNTAAAYTKTRRTAVPVGERRKPRPDGIPGYLRVDSVHQGDRDGEKGVYHITLVDEVTQWMVLCCVPVISERYMIPALREAFARFPFRIVNFHTDNGSEYINYAVEKVLKELGITQTKGRSMPSTGSPSGASSTTAVPATSPRGRFSRTGRLSRGIRSA